MAQRLLILPLMLAVALSASAAEAPIAPVSPERVQQLKDLRWGMFICWSFSTFSLKEWTPGVQDVSFFKPTGCDVEQWARTAKDAGMGYILFLTKHHDGFCLWDTKTTERKVTRSPLGVDVLAALRKACDKHGIKLALYFSEGDWTWPEAVDGKGGKGGRNPEMKKAQLRELLTGYGPIEYIWFDHAVGDGGLSHQETVAWCKSFQPDCFIGFNHGEPAGDIRLGEMGRPSPVSDPSGAGYGAGAARGYAGYLAAEFTYPILPPHPKGAMWFYSHPENDALCHPASKLYRDYLGAVRYGNLFSIDVGPDTTGRLRDIDVQTLRQVGQMIRDKVPLRTSLAEGKPAAASSVWGPGYEAGKAFDGDPATRWGGAPNSRSGWLEVELGAPTSIGEVEIQEFGSRVQKFELQYHEGDTWKTIFAGTTLGAAFRKGFPPVTARRVRLNILEANEVPTLYEVALFGPK